jgi:hypothetical protein
MRLPLILALAAAGIAGCDNKPTERRPEAEQQPRAVPASRPPAGANQPGVTPMNQRVAVIGVLNKRNGIVRDLSMRPGQALRVKDVIVRLRACEASAPWENEKLTGAFVQVDSQLPDQRWQRVFSGWLYKEAPSLNVVEHPVYDVWVKSCAMTFPGGTPVPSTESSNSRSNAPNSEGRSSSRPANEDRATADESNPT